MKRVCTNHSNEPSNFYIYGMSIFTHRNITRLDCVSLSHFTPFMVLVNSPQLVCQHQC